MKIISLESENVKRLKAVRIAPDGNLVVIGGRNGQGKSSVLDSILWAIGGKNAVAKEPIRYGEDHAEIRVDLGEIVVRRTFKGDRSYLSVENLKGQTYKSPQTLLDGLIGRLSFDPLAFARMKPADQLTTLRDLVGLDTTDLDEQREHLYAERTESNREAKRLFNTLSELPSHADAPDAEQSVAELTAQYQAALNAERRRNDLVERIDRCDTDIEEQQSIIARAEKRIAEITAERESLRTTLSQQPDTEEPDGFLERLQSVERDNQKVRDNLRRTQVDEQYKAQLAHAESITEQLKEIDEQRKARMAAASFPIAGLGFDDTGVTYNDVPFEQASSAEQLRVSVAMGLAANPMLRVLLIRDGSLLDAESMELVAQMAAEHDAQLWIERVGDDGSATVVIEDGEVLDAVATAAEGADV